MRQLGLIALFTYMDIYADLRSEVSLMLPLITLVIFLQIYHNHQLWPRSVNISQCQRLFLYLREVMSVNYMSREYTPENITDLEPDDIFVFGSNLQGLHGGGAARVAFRKFGAIWGQGVGIQGQSYAIPTMQGGVETIKPYVDEFTKLAREWDQNRFYVTRIGCGIAGFTDEEIAPLFDEAYDLYNVCLPKSFADIIERNRNLSVKS